MRERAPILLKRSGRFLIAASAPTERFLEELPVGKTLRARTITQPRGRPSNALYWTLLSLVADNLPGDVKDWHLHELLKLEFGVSVTFNLKRGPVTIPGSSSFESMSETEWQAFMPKVLDFLTTEVLPGLGKEDVLEMACQMTGLNPSGVRE